jgi:hypothetical protein
MSDLSLVFKGMTKNHVSQIFHAGHKALDIVGNKTSYGYGTPLCAPENCTVMGITKEELSHDNKGLEHGYGIRLRGTTSNYEYLFWHCLPLFPVWGGDIVLRGQIVAFMGNSGNVYQGGYVPLDKRNTPPFLGTHLHLVVYDRVHKIDIDPIPLFDWKREPGYTVIDAMVATVRVLQKAVKLLTR